jgi:hypothetical protein
MLNSELESAKSFLNAETDPSRRADLLNSIAWKLAIYGVVSDGIAESAAREALKLLDESVPRGSARDRSYAGSQDTLAYIILQRRDPDKQQASLQEAIDLLAQAERLDAGDILFRYAVALHWTNKETDARRKLEDALREKQYEPTHELYLLNRYFTGEFKNEVMNLMRMPRSSPPPGNCPAVRH